MASKGLKGRTSILNLDLIAKKNDGEQTHNLFCAGMLNMLIVQGHDECTAGEYLTRIQPPKPDPLTTNIVTVNIY